MRIEQTRAAQVGRVGCRYEDVVWSIDDLAGREGSSEATDRGFTLIELLIVIVVLGILSTVVVASVQGIVDRGEDATCEGDARTLMVAAESYFAQRGGTVIPATGAVDGDEHERTLMNEGLIREPSALYDLDGDGEILVVAGSRCTTV